MTESTELVARIEKLEASNRRLRRTGAGLALAVGLLGLASFAGPRVCKTVWGERFVLKDGRGRERMVLDAYSGPAPTLTLKDANGEPTAALEADASGEVKLKLFGKDGPTEARLRLTPEGAAGERPGSVH